MNAEHVPASRLVWIAAGFSVWLAAFGVLYGVLSVGCAFGWHEMPILGGITLQRIVLVALFAASLGAGWWVVAIAGRHRREAEAERRIAPFVATAAWLAGWAALASSVLTYAPVFFLTSCY